MKPFMIIENARGPYFWVNANPDKQLTPEMWPVFTLTLAPRDPSRSSMVPTQPPPGSVEIKSSLDALLNTQDKRLTIWSGLDRLYLDTPEPSAIRMADVSIPTFSKRKDFTVSIPSFQFPGLCVLVPMVLMNNSAVRLSLSFIRLNAEWIRESDRCTAIVSRIPELLPIRIF